MSLISVFEDLQNNQDKVKKIVDSWDKSFKEEVFIIDKDMDVFGDLSGHLNKKLYYKASLGVEHSYFRVEDTKTFSSFYLQRAGESTEDRFAKQKVPHN